MLVRFVTQNFIAGEPAYLYIFFKGAGIVSDLVVLDTDANPVFAIEALDAEGNVTTFDDTPSFTVDDESIATVQMNDDGVSGTLVKTGKTGATALHVSSTRSTDGEVLSGMATLTVNPSEETSIAVNLSAGTVAEAVNPGDTVDAAPADVPAPDVPTA